MTFMEQGAVVMSSPLMTHQVHLPAIKKAIVWERPLRVQGKDRPLTLLNEGIAWKVRQTTLRANNQRTSRRRGYPAAD